MGKGRGLLKVPLPLANFIGRGWRKIVSQIFNSDEARGFRHSYLSDSTGFADAAFIA